MSLFYFISNVPLILGAEVVADVATEGVVGKLWQHLLAAIVFSSLGIVLLLISFWTLNRILPFSFHKEIEQDQNVSLAIVIASVIIGMSIIIAAAIVG